jgi:hypothetical protein
MATGWENYESAPLEYFHGTLMELFHRFRIKQNRADEECVIGGIELNDIIAEAKSKTYNKYPEKIISQDPIKKEDMKV